MNEPLLAAISWKWVLREIQQPLVIFGFAAQAVFFARFLVQWYVSERRGRVHIPISFWYLSIAGSLMTLVYAVLRKDLVFSCSQALAMFIYIRNLMLTLAPKSLPGRCIGCGARLLGAPLCPECGLPNPAEQPAATTALKT